MALIVCKNKKYLVDKNSEQLRPFFYKIVGILKVFLTENKNSSHNKNNTSYRCQQKVSCTDISF